MAKQSRSTWQRAERHVAAALGTTRNGNTGHATADVSTDDWCIEVKSWRRLPAKVTAALQQAERAASGQQTPVAVLHEVGARHDGDLVVMRWKDFAALLVGLNPADLRMAVRVGALVALASDEDDEARHILAPDAAERGGR